jgi:hypothetical protein
MTRLLNITLVIEIVVAVWWTAHMVPETGSSGIEVLGWFAVVVMTYVAAFLIGAFVAWRRPSLRRRGALVMAMPFVGGFAPIVLRLFAGGPFPFEGMRIPVAFTLVAILTLGLAFPRRTVRWMPHGLFRSRGWNLFLVGSLGLAWSVLIVYLLWLVSQGGQDALRAANRTGSPGMATAAVILLVASNLLLLGLGSAFTGAWGWLGLRGGVDGAQRRIHVAQLLGAAPGILLAAITWVWLSGQGLR